MRQHSWRSGICLSGRHLGRPRSKSDLELLTEDKRQYFDDQKQRNAFEGKIGQGKRRIGSGLIRGKLAVAHKSSIVLNVLKMNLEMLLEVLFVHFTSLLRLHLVDKSDQNIRALPLKPQITAV